MRKTIPSARDWSETVRPREFWAGSVDLYVLKQYDRILGALGRQSTARGTRGGLHAGRFAREGPAPILVVASLSATAVFGGRAGQSPMVQDPVSSEIAHPAVFGCLVIALLAELAILYWWWRNGRRWSRNDMITLGICIGAAAFTLFGMGNVFSIDVLGPGATVLVLWAAIVLAVAALLTMAVASRGPDAVSEHFRFVGRPDPERARELVDGLDPAARDHLNNQRADAIATLRERGLLEWSEATDLQNVPLGMSPTVGHDFPKR